MSTRHLAAGGVRLTVDHDLCSGTGHCRDIAPELFHVRDGRAWLAEDVDLTAVGDEALKRAEAGCPWFAITHQPGLSADADRRPLTP